MQVQGAGPVAADAGTTGAMMKPLPASQKRVLEILGTGRAMTHKEIMARVDCSPRTVRDALKKLRQKELLIVKMNLHDMRQVIYQCRPVVCIPNGGNVHQ